MKVIWDWSLELEAKRLVEMCHHSACDFFRLHHFLPLSFRPEVSRPNASHHVYLPDLNYSSIPRFWEEMVKINTTSPYRPNSFNPNQLLGLLEGLKLNPLTLPRLVPLVEQYLPLTHSWLRSTFPNLPLPNTVLIHPSYFGTSGSFDWSPDYKTITLSLRSDSDLHSLIEIYLSAIIRPHAGNTLYLDWEKTEYLVDYLLLESSLRPILPQSRYWQPTTTPPYFSPRLIHESNTFLQKIGCPTAKVLRFHQSDQQIFFGDTLLTSLTSKEHALLSALITRAPSPLTTDEVADLIFPSDLKYSLGALTKTIERFRKKLIDLGISSSYIATASGIGYYLKN